MCDFEPTGLPADNFSSEVEVKSRSQVHRQSSFSSHKVPRSTQQGLSNAQTPFLPSLCNPRDVSIRARMCHQMVHLF